MPFQVADGHDNEASYVAISPEPATPDGMDYAELNFYAGGNAEVDGVLHQALVWNNITRAQRDALLTVFGLSLTVRSNDITIQTRMDAASTFDDYNCTVYYIKSEKRIGASPLWNNFTLILSYMVAS